MGVKRGTSGLSLVVGIDKPVGMSSHDVVNRCRFIFGERRVGHTGTLDPLASGVLVVCVGPATRLDAYLTEHDKRYRVRVVFGSATDTDDCTGSVIRIGEVPSQVYDASFARAFVSKLVGARKQLPPAYSAIKVDGVKSCDAARRGHIIDLAPRDIEVYDAHLEGIDNGSVNGSPAWDISFHVSKGTYIRALARDIGVALGIPTHVGALRREYVGDLGLEECVGLDTLERVGTGAAIDPVRLLGLRFAFLDEMQETKVANGCAFRCNEVRLFERRRTFLAAELCACTAGVQESCHDVCDKELVSVIARNKLVALYEYNKGCGMFQPRCVFQTGVSRGEDM